MKIGKLLAIIMMGVVTMNSVGCVNTKSYEDIAKEKLYERYQEEFEIEEVQSHHYFDGYYTVIAYPKSNPDILFSASINDDDSKESDNYVCKLLCQRLSDQVAKNINGLNGIYYIYSIPRIDVVNIGNKEITISEFMQEHPSSAFRTYIFYYSDNLDTQRFASNIQQAFDGLENVNGKINLYIVPNENILSEIQQYIETHDQLYDEFKEISEKYYKGTINYKNGSFDCTVEEIQGMVR